MRKSQRDPELHARPDHDSEPPGHDGRAEHVAVHELPARLLLTLLQRAVAALVALKVALERVEHDHAWTRDVSN